MKDRVKTLVLYANGAKLPAILVETTLRGILRIDPAKLVPDKWMRRAIIRKFIGQRYEMSSYMDDWKDAFGASPELDVELCNISNVDEYYRYRNAIKNYPLVVILHSAAGDSMFLLSRTRHWFQKRKGKLLVFIGNEYDLMDEKIDFLKLVEANYVASQLPMKAARWLYEECKKSEILPAPHALNPEIYYPSPVAPIVTDLGFVGDHYPFFVGDMERSDFIRYVQSHGSQWGLKVHVSTQRVRRSEWARLLRGFRGVVGAESGTYYLERDSKTINAVKAYLRKKPSTSFSEIYGRFFRDYENPMSGKAISSRHFEPIGTKTCQVLIEGSYNGILTPDEHYISVKKDLTNIDDAIDRFRDISFRDAIVKRAFEYGMDQHTYHHRVKSLLCAIGI